MPGVKDITRDIGKLRNKDVLPKGQPPVAPQFARLERKLGFNATGYFSWIMIGFFLALQLFFLLWLVI